MEDPNVLADEIEVEHLIKTLTGGLIIDREAGRLNLNDQEFEQQAKRYVINSLKALGVNSI